jgi:bifunctional NMN adenylyltransferase/nudix hydrolase
MKTLGALIGRFSPRHSGHHMIIQEAMRQCDHLLILIGSANRPRSIKNPWTYDERFESMRGWITGLSSVPNHVRGRVSILPLNDYRYSNQQWLSDVTNVIETFRHFQFGSELGDAPHEAVIFGHDKPGNDYLSWFKQYRQVNLESGYKVNSTQVREDYFRSRHSVIPPDVQADWDYYQKEHATFKDYPYPQTLNFNCADAVVECAGHVLLVKRKNAPGKNCWALPGGFKNRNETFRECALRELIEETNIRVPERVLRKSVVSERLFDDPNRSFGTPRNTMAYHFRVEPDADGQLPRANGGDDVISGPDGVRWAPLAEAVNSIPLYDDHQDIVMSMLGVMAVPAHLNPNYRKALSIEV